MTAGILDSARGRLQASNGQPLPRALQPIERRWFQQEEGVYCEAVPPGHEPVGENVTSGSTGEFLRVRRTRVNQLIWLAMVLRDHVWRGTDFSVPLTSVRAPNVGIKEFPDRGVPMSWLFPSGPALAMPTKLPGRELYDRMAAFGTGIYPNALGTVLDEVEARGKLKNLKAIRTVGEMVSDPLRERTRERLGIEIADAYTCQEAGYIALQCPDSGLYHFMAEALIVEVLRDDGTPCEDGEIGRVVITDIHNHATPIVRLCTGRYGRSGRAVPVRPRAADCAPDRRPQPQSHPLADRRPGVAESRRLRATRLPARAADPAIPDLPDRDGSSRSAARDRSTVYGGR